MPGCWMGNATHGLAWWVNRERRQATSTHNSGEEDAMRRVAVVVLLLILSSSCGVFVPAPEEMVTPSEDEYLVYSTLIEEMVGDAELIVIRDSTGLDFVDDISEAVEQIRKSTLGAGEGVLGDFRVKAAYPLQLENRFSFTGTIVLMSQEEFDSIFMDGGVWDEFYERYPKSSNGIMTFSRVGFNSQLDEALVYVGIQAHFKDGAGYYVFLEKLRDGWTIGETTMAWVF
jgi:hypothetical protein